MKINISDNDRREINIMKKRLESINNDEKIIQEEKIINKDWLRIYEIKNQYINDNDNTSMLQEITEGIRAVSYTHLQLPFVCNNIPFNKSMDFILHMIAH